MLFYYPKDVDFIENFGCEAYYVDDTLCTIFYYENGKFQLSMSRLQSSIKLIYEINNMEIINIYKEGAIILKIVDQSRIEILFDNYVKKMINVIVYPIFSLSMVDFVD